MARHMHKDALAIFAQGQIQDEAKKIGYRGGGWGGVEFPSSKNFFFRPEGYSNKLNS